MSALSSPSPLSSLTFDNRSLRELPVDTGPNVVRTVRGAAFARVSPTPLDEPSLVALSPSALALLGLDAAALSARADTAALLSGSAPLPGAAYAAHCYCGHQFGSFAGQLGDGATMYVGEVLVAGGAAGAPPARWELQFKGAGTTPFSRTADGRKVLRSSIREFLASEALAGLHIPTTRAGSVVVGATTVVRDILYDGNARPERCAVITRLAPTFLRFGSLEVARGRDPSSGRAGPSPGDGALLEALLGFTCRHFFPRAAAALAASPREAFAAMYTDIVARTARLAAAWQAVGFCHGVLNTDNMSLVGLTLDYGPFGFLEAYDPDFVCNGSDSGGRYSYAAQPAACRWNCLKLGESMAAAPSLRGEGRPGEGAWDYRAAAAAAFDGHFAAAYHTAMRRKLGLSLTPADVAEVAGAGGGALGASDGAPAPTPAEAAGGMSEEDMGLLAGLLDTMRTTGADYTLTLRALCEVRLEAGASAGEAAQGSSAGEAAAGALGDPAAAGALGDPVLAAILRHCAPAARLAASQAPRVPLAQLRALARMAAAAPPGAQHGIDMEAVEAELARHAAASAAARRSEADKAAEDALAWRAWLRRYRQRLSRDTAPPGLDRRALMRACNPAAVLRNWVAAEAIARAEAGEAALLRRVLRRLSRPFHDEHEVEGEGEEEEPEREGREGPARAGASGAPCAQPPPRALSLDATAPPHLRELVVT